MAAVTEVAVPDIGDFTDVPVIEILVSVGDTVSAEDPLVTLESDKATMDVPAPSGGTVKEIKVSVGDKVSEGTVIVTLEDPGGDGDEPEDEEPDKETGGDTDAGGSEATEVKVPDIGDFTDVPVIEIHVKPGDEVEEEDPLLTLESDKATMDVPAPSAGTVREVLVSVGDKVSEGTVILTLEGAGGEQLEPKSDAGEQAEPKQEAEQEPERREPHEQRPESGQTEATGYGDAGDAGDAPSDEPAPPSGGPVHASPSVRKLAREKGIDLSKIKGTGRKGRITKADVERGPAPAPAGGDQAGAGAGADLGLAPWPQIDFAKFGEIERVPLTRIQKISGPNLARNWVRIPHVTHNDEADITDLEAFRKQINAEQKNVKVTMVALLLKACVASLKAYPRFNSSLDGDELVLKRYYHLGFAADTPNGLLVPVIKDVDKKGILDLAAELTELSGKAREGKLGPGSMTGATFTISSLGGIGGTSFTPIINAPEVAILGVTRSAMKPVWDGTDFVPRLMVPLSLSYDHRVIDGALAARFMVHLVGVLSDLKRVLL